LRQLIALFGFAAFFFFAANGLTQEQASPLLVNIPEFWRASTPDDAKLLRAVSTRGLLLEARTELGEYRGGIDTSAEADESRGRFTEWILEKKHPGLLTLHLSSLDHIEHETGPFSPESINVLESIDATIGKIRATAERLAPGRAYVAVVSDHGFVRTESQLNLFPLFRDAKLITDCGTQARLADGINSRRPRSLQNKSWRHAWSAAGLA
jgi:hypothetical protein